MIKRTIDFKELLDRWHILNHSEKNAASRSMNDAQKATIRFKAQIAELDWKEYQDNLRADGF